VARQANLKVVYCQYIKSASKSAISGWNAYKTVWRVDNFVNKLCRIFSQSTPSCVVFVSFWWGHSQASHA
jgi:hypothetical protein